MARSQPFQYSAIHTLISRLKISQEDKEAMVISYTGDPLKVSLKDMTFENCADMRKKLQDMTQPGKVAQASYPKPANIDKEADKAQRQKLRLKICALCHQLGWYRQDDNSVLILKDGKKQLDFDRINKYCLLHTKCKRYLNAMNVQQLQGAIYQFEQMYKNYIVKPIQK